MSITAIVFLCFSTSLVFFLMLHIVSWGLYYCTISLFIITASPSSASSSCTIPLQDTSHKTPCSAVLLHVIRSRHWSLSLLHKAIRFFFFFAVLLHSWSSMAQYCKYVVLIKILHGRPLFVLVLFFYVTAETKLLQHCCIAVSCKFL